jgi:putative membrane protein
MGMTDAMPLLASVVWAQERTWEGPWEAHPLWGPVGALGVGVLLLIFLGWVLLHLVPLVLAIVAGVLGIRWLMRTTERPRSDPALSLLRERYARGEIGKEEFDAKLRDLGASSLRA